MTFHKSAIENLPSRYGKIWDNCLPLLKQGRPGDDEHAKEVVEFILNYRGKLKIDKTILIPLAMMHDIGHAAILPEHFKYVTGPEKITNGKLVHMLAGAKIAYDILKRAHYNPQNSREIVDIISIHDADQLEGTDLGKVYNTENKKIFHDIDSLDRYNTKRVNNISSIWKDKNRLFGVLEDYLRFFFYDEFKNIAKDNLRQIKDYYATK